MRSETRFYRTRMALLATFLLFTVKLAEALPETSYSPDHSRSVVVENSGHQPRSIKFYRLTGSKQKRQNVDWSQLADPEVDLAINVRWPKKGPYVAIEADARHGGSVYFTNLDSRDPKLMELSEPKWEQIFATKEIKIPKSADFVSTIYNVMFESEGDVLVEYSVDVWQNNQNTKAYTFRTKYDLTKQGKLLSLNLE